MSASRRPSSAPVRHPQSPLSPSGNTVNGAFIHRDIFAPHIPGGHHRAPLDAAAAPASSASPFQTPPRHRKIDSSASIIPSAKKLEQWDHKLEAYPLLGWLEAHTGVRKVYLASVVLIGVLLLVFRGTGLGLVSVCVGFLYPLHMSLKTIENCTSLFEEISGENRARHTEQEIREKRGEIVGQLRKWLVYWVVYGLFNTFESVSDFSLSWLPIYHPLKLLFLLWCFLPQYQGSQLVFDILVRPVLKRHEEAIEEGVQTAQQAALFSAQRVGRVVRAKSIALSNVIQQTGQQLSQRVVGSGYVGQRVAEIEHDIAASASPVAVGGLSQISEGLEYASPVRSRGPSAASSASASPSDEGKTRAAFDAARRLVEAREQQQKHA